MNANLQKYLKYKSKYLDLKNELEGGVPSDRIRGLFNKQFKKGNAEKIKQQREDIQIIKLNIEKQRQLYNQILNSVELEQAILIKFLLDNLNNLNTLNITRLEKQYNIKYDEYLSNLNNYNKKINIIIKNYNNLIKKIDKVPDVRNVRREQANEEEYVGGAYTELTNDDFEYLYNKDLQFSTVYQEFKDLNIQSELKKIQLVIKQLEMKKSFIDKRLTKKPPSSNDDSKKPPSSNYDGKKPPSPNDDGYKPSSNDDDLDCNELQRNIKTLCDNYKNIKSTNNDIKNKIRGTFNSVNQMINEINILDLDEDMLSDEDVISLSEENEQKLQKQQKYMPSVASILLKIHNEKDLEKKKKLVQKFKHIQEVKENYPGLINK